MCILTPLVLEMGNDYRKNYTDRHINALPTCGCDEDGITRDHSPMIVKGDPVESLSGEVNSGDGERGIVGDGIS